MYLVLNLLILLCQILSVLVITAVTVAILAAEVICRALFSGAYSFIPSRAVVSSPDLIFAVAVNHDSALASTGHHSTSMSFVLSCQFVGNVLVCC